MSIAKTSFVAVLSAVILSALSGVSRADFVFDFPSYLSTWDLQATGSATEFDGAASLTINAAPAGAVPAATDKLGVVSGGTQNGLTVVSSAGLGGQFDAGEMLLFTFDQAADITSINVFGLNVESTSVFEWLKVEVTGAGYEANLFPAGAASSATFASATNAIASVGAPLQTFASLSINVPAGDTLKLTHMQLGTFASLPSGMRINSISAVPEPATAALSLLGLVGAAIFRRRR